MIVLVVALFNVPIFVRLVRTQVLSLRDRTFVEAARASCGQSLSLRSARSSRTLSRPPRPRLSITLGGRDPDDRGPVVHRRGRPPAEPGVGRDDRSGANGIVIGQWWTSVFPGAAITLTVFGFAAVGEGLRASC